MKSFCQETESVWSTCQSPNIFVPPHLRTHFYHLKVLFKGSQSDLVDKYLLFNLTVWNIVVKWSQLNVNGVNNKEYWHILHRVYKASKKLWFLKWLLSCMWLYIKQSFNCIVYILMQICNYAEYKSSIILLPSDLPRPSMVKVSMHICQKLIKVKVL